MLAACAVAGRPKLAASTADRQIDGLDMREFLLGGAESSGRDAVLCLRGNRLQAIKWRQWKMHLFQQDVAASTFVPYSAPHLHNLERDPREEHEIGFPHGWVIHPMAGAIASFLKSLTAEPPTEPGTRAVLHHLITWHQPTDYARGRQRS